MSKEKICKFCKSPLPKGAKVCPTCSRAQKNHGCLLSIIILVIISAAAIAITLNMDSAIQKGVSGVNDTTEYITMAEYNQIKSGMTYDEVVKIIGSNGKESSSAGSDNYSISIYTWYGNGVAGSNANVTFTNGKVTGKAQVGLK